MKRSSTLCLLLIAAAGLSACARQSTPSMMNTTLPRVNHETAMTQIPVNQVSSNYLYSLADQYRRYGMDQLRLSLAYDPAAKNYSASKAFKDLSKIKAGLAEYGVTSVSAETVQTSGIEPTLMVSYDSARALAPDGCRNMPGLDNALTTEKIYEYRFGCSVDAMVANQIYRPSDLQGNDAGEPGDGRRAATTVEYYRQRTADEAAVPLNRIGRSDIQDSGGSGQ